MNYEAMKAEYTSDPYNIPEKLYAYYNANGYSRKEVIDINDKIEKSIYQGGVAERNIPEGKDEKSYKKLIELLGGFGFDHNYSINLKRKLLQEIGSAVLAHIPYPPSKPLDNSFLIRMYNQYYQTTGNSTHGEEGSENEFADPNWNANHTKEGGRRIRRKTRRNRRTRRKSYRRRR